LPGIGSNSSSAPAATNTGAQLSLNLLDHDDWTEFASAPAATEPASSSISSAADSKAQDPFAASNVAVMPASLTQAAPPDVAAVQPVKQLEQPVAAAAAADPFANIGSHDLISSIQGISVTSNSSSDGNSTLPAGSSNYSSGSGSATGNSTVQHARTNSSSSKASVEDILKLYDAPKNSSAGSAAGGLFSLMPGSMTPGSPAASQLGKLPGVSGLQQQQQQQGGLSHLSFS
jgi:hypothetical protein